MASIAHLGIALGFLLLLPDVSILILILCSFLLDLLFFVFMFMGLEDMPNSERVSESPWSHSLFMAMMWSTATTMAMLLISNDPSTSILIGLLVFSHWAIDFIVSPMTSVFPKDTGKLLHPFGNSPKVGLGVMRTKSGVILIEGGSFLIGGVLFLSTIL
ncbi:MAG: hypothetical protein ACW98I_15055 [Candidatus Hodarchaeales archaeon]|jgi:hypothetical protein